MSETPDEDWLTQLAPYCGATVPESSCELRPSRWHMCVAAPDHERGQQEHHVCACGHAWVTEPRIPGRHRPC